MAGVDILESIRTQIGDRAKQDERLMTMSMTLRYVSLYLVVAIGTYVGIVKLRRRTPSHVYVLIYFASLSGWLTLLVGGYALSNGAFDGHGQPQGMLGHAMLTALQVFADVATDFEVVAALVSVVIVPQMVAYLLSLFAGCASRVRFIEAALDFLAWSFAKSLAVASGVFYSAVCLQIYEGWHDWLASNVMAKITLASVLFMASLYMLIQKQGFDKQWMSKKLQRAVRAIDSFARRHVTAIDSASESAETRAEREACAQLLELDDSQIRLAGGEIDPDAMRTVQAILAWRARLIRARGT